jgi:chemotaxis protein CheX
MGMAEDVLREDLARVSNAIWRDMLECELHEIEPPEFSAQVPVLLGKLNLSGAFNAELYLLISPGLLRVARGKMFAGAAFALSDEHSEDVLKELVNMTGGNLKNVVPEPTVISLPVVERAEAGKIAGILQQAQIKMQYGNAQGWFCLCVIEDSSMITGGCSSGAVG